jgi:serine/threonine protein kinase
MSNIYNEALPIGEKIENQNEVYIITQIINKGGFSFVYGGEMIVYSVGGIMQNELYRQRVVIKELFIDDRSRRSLNNELVWNDEHNTNSLSKKIKEKTKSEATKLFNLKSPYILQVINAFEMNNTIYMVTKEIEGAEDFGDILGLETDKPHGLEINMVLKYMNQICAALKVVHEKNILHLDIKPDNVLRDIHDNAILIDFGISVSTDEKRKSVILGARTPHYSPPEQASNVTFSSISFATDLYALGCTLFVFLTGRLVPDVAEIVSGDKYVAAPSGYNKAVSPYLDDVVLKAISLKREDRYQTIEEFTEALNGEEKYNRLILEAKQSIAAKDWGTAREKLDETRKLIPEGDEVVELGRDIDEGIQDDITKSELVELEVKADRLFKEAKYKEALALYNELPQDEKVASNIKLIQKALREQKIRQLKNDAETYQQSNQLQKALETYIELKRIAHTGQDIDAKIDELQGRILEDQQYDQLIQEADALFKVEDYARRHYQV